MGKLTYEEFVKTGRNMILANTNDPTLYGDLEFGRVYAGFCAIALQPNGKWLLVIENGSWEDWDVQNLEKLLYEEFYTYNCEEN